MDTPATVGAIFDYLDERAPFATAEEWDNAGLLAGNRDMPVQRILVTLDITPAAVEAAAQAGAQLIVSHHPVIFSPLRALERESAPWLLARRDIAAICAHTNLDMAAGGVNDALAALLGLTAVHTAADGLCRIGRLETPLSPRALAERTAQRLHTAVRMHAGNRPVRTVCVCGGAGGDCVLPLAAQADALLTGEVRHHEWLEGARSGATVIEAGHYATEAPVTTVLAAWLRERFPGVGCAVFDSGAPYETVGAQTAL